MEVIDFNTLVEEKKYKDSPVVLAIGVFDGVHKGHRRLLSTLEDLKNGIPGAISIVISFNMNPKLSSSGSLDTIRLREEEMRQIGVNSFVLIDFSENFSRISASGFSHSLAECLNPLYLVVGRDFRCGHPSSSTDGPGLCEMLRKEGRSTRLIQVDYVLAENGEKVSSSMLRKYITSGEVCKYRELSGEFFRIDLDPLPSRFENGGIVFEYMSSRQLLPPPGVYEAELHLKNGKKEACLLTMTEEFLRLSGFVSSSVFGSEEGRGEIMTQKDYLSIIRSN